VSDSQFSEAYYIRDDTPYSPWRWQFHHHQDKRPNMGALSSVYLSPYFIDSRTKHFVPTMNELKIDSSGKRPVWLG
jgi:hypothetical protein